MKWPAASRPRRRRVRDRSSGRRAREVSEPAALAQRPSRWDAWLLGKEATVTYARHHREHAALAAGIFTPLLVSAALVPIRTSFADTASALLLVGVVAAIAVAGTRASGYVASVSAAIWFDFFLTTPYERLVMDHQRDVETTICLLFVGIVVTELAARSRRYRLRSIDEAQHVTLIHHAANLAASPSGDTSRLVEEVENSLTSLLGLRSCHFEPNSGTQPPTTWIDLDVSVVHGALIWPAHDIGIPGREAEVPARWRGRTMGRFVVVPTPGEPVELEERLVATALVDLVGAALATPVATRG